MKLAVFVLIALGVGANDNTPIDKVVVLLKNLQSSIEDDGKSEQASYDNYACWVESTLQRKAKDISEAKDLLEELGDSIVKLKADIASHEAEIAQLNKDIAQNEEAIKEAKAIRDKEYKEYEEEKTESEQCIGALEQAIKVLTGAGTKKAFLQQAQLLSIAGGVRRVMARPATRSMVSENDFQVVRHFLEKPDDFGPATGMIAAQIGQNPFGDYAPQSSQIQGILKGMYDAFTSELEKDNAEEANKQKSFEELFGTKMQELKTLKLTLAKQEKDSAVKTKDLAADETMKDDTTEQLEADEKFFEETKSSAETKAKEWSTRTRLRTEELAGIQGAIQILTEGSGVFEKSMSFAQLKVVSKHTDRHQEAYAKLRTIAAKHQSREMEEIMTVLKEGGHFDKVITMIDAMIALLRKEEQEDISHKDRCDREENGNKNDLEDVDGEIFKSKENLERMGNKEENLDKELAKVEAEINATKTDMQDMLDQRNKEVAEFKYALKMDADAIALIEMAVVKIQKYYKENGIPLSLSQQGQPEYSQDPDKAPETNFNKADAHEGETGGIVSILDMIAEDLQKEMAEAKADNAKAQEEYEKARGALEDSLDAQRETKVSLEKELAALEDSMSAAEKRKMEQEADKKGEEDMKQALEVDCKWVKTNFESRRKKRKTEMAGLVEAKDFLAGVEAGDAVLAP
jgi:predicted  nucleic acid-binding Zn-ribbon protein